MLYAKVMLYIMVGALKTYVYFYNKKDWILYIVRDLAFSSTRY